MLFRVPSFEGHLTPLPFYRSHSVVPIQQVFYRENQKIWTVLSDLFRRLFIELVLQWRNITIQNRDWWKLMRPFASRLHFSFSFSTVVKQLIKGECSMLQFVSGIMHGSYIGYYEVASYDTAALRQHRNRMRRDVSDVVDNQPLLLQLKALDKWVLSFSLSLPLSLRLVLEVKVTSAPGHGTFFPGKLQTRNEHDIKGFFNELPCQPRPLSFLSPPVSKSVPSSPRRRREFCLPLPYA